MKKSIFILLTTLFLLTLSSFAFAGGDSSSHGALQGISLTPMNASVGGGLGLNLTYDAQNCTPWCTWTVPSGVTRIKVELLGGPGGGGGGRGTWNSTTLYSWYGGSGGGGAYLRNILNVLPGDVFTIIPGPGGNSGANGTAAVPATAGGNGTATTFSGTFGTLTANGGGGGQPTTSTAVGAGGTGASASPGGTPGPAGLPGNTFSQNVSCFTTSTCSFIPSRKTFTAGPYVGSDTFSAITGAGGGVVQNSTTTLSISADGGNNFTTGYPINWMSGRVKITWNE